MPSLDERRSRNDSVAEHLASIHARTKQVVPASSIRTSFSLYPSCTPISPVSPLEGQSVEWPPKRPTSTSNDTVIFAATPDDDDAIDATGEPLYDDFQQKLSAAPRQLRKGISLPGLDDGVSRVLPHSRGPPAAQPPDVSKTRLLTSVTHHPSVEAKRRSRIEADAASSSNTTTPDLRTGSSTSPLSDISSAPSDPTLVPLQTHGLQDDNDAMETVSADDPKSYDLLVAASVVTRKGYALEDRAIKLFSRDHLRQIFADPQLLVQFSAFLNAHRPSSVRLLMFYFDALKASRAISYSNAIAKALGPLEGYEFTKIAPSQAYNTALEDRAHKAFDALASDDLAAYITYIWTRVVSDNIQRRVTGTLAPILREASEGLAEVFCLSDPSRPDNPIVFASPQFQKTTQYGMNHCVGRNCRFLQGPATDSRAVSRIGAALRAGKEHSEVFVNYRRDGQPFMNLLMIAPLHDARGTIRYFIGAQVDVSGLTKDATDLEGLRRLLKREVDSEYARRQDEAAEKDELQALSEMFNRQELDTVQQHGGHMHRSHFDDVKFENEAVADRRSVGSDKPRLLITDHTASNGAIPVKHPDTTNKDIESSGRLQGVYQHYLLIRPAPSLRILFTSPSLRIPGIMQTPFLSRVGGSHLVREELRAAFAEGRGVTAKVRWLPRPGADDDEGRTRWIHATPLLNHKGEVGVWMVVLVDGDNGPGEGRRRFKAPPVIPAHADQLHMHQRDSLNSRTSSKRSAQQQAQKAPATQQLNGNPMTNHHRMTVGGTPFGGTGAAQNETSGRTMQDYDLKATYMPSRSDLDVRRLGSVTFFDDADAKPPQRSFSAQEQRSKGISR